MSCKLNAHNKYNLIFIDQFLLEHIYCLKKLLIFIFLLILFFYLFFLWFSVSYWILYYMHGMVINHNILWKIVMVQESIKSWKEGRESGLLHSRTFSFTMRDNVSVSYHNNNVTNDCCCCLLYSLDVFRHQKLSLHSLLVFPPVNKWLMNL